MSRTHFLLALMGLAVIGVIASFIWLDAGAYWSELASSDPGGRPAQPVQASPAGTGGGGAPTAKTPAARRLDSTMLRELPRQALFIAAAHGLGLAGADRSIDFAGGTQPLPLSCRTTYSGREGLLRVTLHDATGAGVRAVELPAPMLVANHPDYATIAAAVEPWCDGEFVSLLTGALAGREARRVKQDDSLPVPAEVEALLAQVDPQRAFLAAHLLHGAIAESGESPLRLAGLVRAYSHLGDATRYLYSPHGSAFFARALIYAERLVRRHPDLALSHAARGYAYTLFGQPQDGRRALDRARELATAAGTPLPGWAMLADDLNHFRTRALFGRVGGDHPESALASYFALLTVEHSGLQSIVINLARLALEANPGALRVINIMTDNSGVSLHHETTERSTQAQFELLAQLADAPGVPEPVTTAAKAAQAQRFAPEPLLELLATMDRQSAGTGQLLTWGAYASISRDALFVSGFRRLYFTGQMLAVDPGERLKAWWPMLKDHRFAPLLAGFDRTGQLGGREAVVAVQRLGFNDFHQRMPSIVDTVKRLRRPDEPFPWIENYEYESDHTAYDLANLLWTYRGKEADAIAMLGGVKGELAKQLAAMCPDHPSALAELIVNRWPETRSRAAEIERDMAGHPQVAYALARAYRSEQRFADAARLLEQAIAISPDPAIYEELAEMYKQQGDDEKWLAIYETYLASSEDFGLDHAKKNERVAYTLMGMGKSEKALKYAEAAAASGSAWGMRVHAACLTELGHYEKAEAIERMNQQRYPMSFAWYRWCQTTGRGDLAAARRASEASVATLEAQTVGEGLNEIAIYHALEGRPDRARDCWERQLRRGTDPYGALQLTLLGLEQGRPMEEIELRLAQVSSGQAPGLPPEMLKLMGTVTPLAEQTRSMVYGAAIEEVQRCLTDSRAVPRRDGEQAKTVLDAVGTPYRVNAAYVLGRLCELRGNAPEAEWWYRAALESREWTASCRPQAAAGLRRLGKEFYPRPPTTRAAASTP